MVNICLCSLHKLSEISNHLLIFVLLSNYNLFFSYSMPYSFSSVCMPYYFFIYIHYTRVAVQCTHVYIIIWILPYTQLATYVQFRCMHSVINKWFTIICTVHIHTVPSTFPLIFTIFFEFNRGKTNGEKL